jgi:prophage DNA circulation protein
MSEITVEKAERDEETLLERAEEAFGRATEMFERGVEAQSEFAESMAMNVEGTAEDSEEIPEMVEGFASAYELYAEATEEIFDMAAESYEEGEAPELTEMRNIWLEATNEAAKEVMSTQGFAAARGNATGSSLEAKKEFDESRDELLRSTGMATESTVVEVGERLVELERRQHEVEKKLDRLIEKQEQDGEGR